MDEVIVVGIDNTPDRIPEYTPCCDPKYGGGKLDRYDAFVVDTVKPWVDRTYRTLPGRENTALMGSSLGALASLWTAARHPAVFAKAAGLSGSFWWNDGMFIKQPPEHGALRLYIDAGTVDDGLEDTKKMRDALVAKGYVLGQDLLFNTAQGARHNEKSWAARVEQPLTWMFPWGSTRQ